MGSAERAVERIDPNRYDWPPQLVALLGKISDRELARRAGVHIEAVIGERRRRGIPPAFPQRPPIEWTPEMIALLGTGFDYEVAAELGLKPGAVHRKRRILGIPPFGRPSPRKRPFWTPARDRLLGTAPDLEVARKLGTSRTSAKFRRHLLGIPPFAPRAARVVWTPKMLRLLGTRPDAEIARRFGITKKAVRLERHRRRIPGTRRSGKLRRTRRVAEALRLPTVQACERLGVVPATVYKLRQEYGIPSPPRESAWTNRALSRLGKVPDAELAAELGLRVDTVRLKREEHGILLRHRWKPEEEDLLGKIPDAALARRLDCTVGAVRKRRFLVAARRRARQRP